MSRLRWRWRWLRVVAAELQMMWLFLWRHDTAPMGNGMVVLYRPELHIANHIAALQIFCVLLTALDHWSPDLKVWMMFFEF
jgi:hypothetical protein